MHHKHNLELFKVDADLTSLCRLAESEIMKSKIDREETIFKMIGKISFVNSKLYIYSRFGEKIGGNASADTKQRNIR